MFKPDVSQFATEIRIQHRVTTIINGAPKAAYTDADPAIQYCCWKPFFGSEAVQAGAVGITDGATVTMWYDPASTVRDRVLLNDDASKAYEVVSSENVENRNQYLILKVRRMVNA